MNVNCLLEEARAVQNIDWALQQDWPLSRGGADRCGPCPKCGGEDRFSINITKNAWHCRKCEKGGGDVISLVMHVEDADFKTALERITGRKAADPVDPKEQERRARELAAKKQRQEAFAESARRKSQERARRILKQALAPKPYGAVSHYLRIRGLSKIADAIDAGRSKLLLAEISAYERRLLVGKGRSKTWETIWTGPAMVASIRQPNNQAMGVHLTFLDADAPKGKARMVDPNDGKELRAKIMVGSQMQGAIRLYTPKRPKGIVMGEGIETTLTALQEAFMPGYAYWAAGSLVNMAGGVLIDADNKRQMDMPDLNKPAFVPPPWCQELIFLRDSDSDSTATENKLIRGARRAMAMRPGLKARIADAMPGKDFNDMLAEGA
jgi:hypothetical protein